MTMHARDVEPDLGALIDLDDDVPDEALGRRRAEPRLEAASPRRPAGEPPVDDFRALRPERRVAPVKAEPSFTARRPETPPTAAALTFRPTGRIGEVAPVADLPRDEDDEPVGTPFASAVLGAWGGFWRAVVIGVVSGVVGGVVGAFTLVWLTGAGWATFAKLLIEAIGRL
jgi:hypothetical protein